MHVQIGGGRLSEGFDTSQLSAYSRQLLNAASRENPQRIRQFMRKEGSKLRTKTKKTARSKVKKKSGNFQKSITRGKPYRYGSDDAIRVYSASAHAHLIEDGHRIVRNGRELGFVPGKKVFRTAQDEFQPTFERDVDGLCDELARGAER